MHKRKTFQRAEILRRLKDTEASGVPIIGAGSSCGLVAKCAEQGGADLIIVYSTGLSRLKGLPTTILGDSNLATMQMAEEILNVVAATPVIAGIEANDPRFWDLSYLIDKFMAEGYSGLISYPTIGFFEPESLWRRMNESVGLGLSREAEMIRCAKEKEIFTMAYVFRADEAKVMAEAGLDCAVAHVGGTAGGMVGVDADPMDQAVEAVRAIHAAAVEANPDIICLAHGGPFVGPAETEPLYARTEVAGFVGASSIERVPIEQAVVGVVQQFKSRRTARAR